MELRPESSKAARSMRRLTRAMGLLAAASLFAASPASANCNLIPAAVASLRSNTGAVDRAIAGPGALVTVQADLACQPNAVGFSPTAAENVVTLQFEPPAGSGAPATIVAIDPASVLPLNCGSARCDTLRFAVPDTDALLPPAGDDNGLVGPARIRITNLAGALVRAEVFELFEPTLACNDRTPHATFPTFTVLPQTNPLPGANATLTFRSAVDRDGNLLIPLEFRATLPARPGDPLARILAGQTDIDASTANPGVPISIPAATQADPFEFVRSYNVAGRPIPPVLEVGSSGDSIFGSIDAAESVLRLAAREPGAPTPIFEFRDRMFAGRGPVAFGPVAFGVREAGPLASLRPSRNIVAIARDESIEGDLNLDGDTDDSVVQVIDVATGVGANTGRAGATSFSELAPTRSRFSLAADGDIAAFLSSEAEQGSFLNNDNDRSDYVLQVFSKQGRDLGVQGLDGLPRPIHIRLSADPALAFGGTRAVAVTGNTVLFRRPEAGDPLLETVCAPNTAILLNCLGNGAAGEAALSGDGRVLAFVSAAGNLTGEGGSISDVFVHIAGTAPTRVSVNPAFPSGLVANGPSGHPSLSDDGRFVAFHSDATNLRGPGGDPNGARDVFVRDRLAASLSYIGPGENPSISGDGRLVAYESATDSTCPGQRCVFVYNRQQAVRLLAGRYQGPSLPIAPLNGPSRNPVLSRDGRWLAFETDATDLPGFDGNGVTDVVEFFVLPDAGSTVLSARGRVRPIDPSFASPPFPLQFLEPDGPSYRPSYSRDGHVLAFVSEASNFGAVSNGQPSVVIRYSNDIASFLVPDNFRYQVLATIPGTLTPLNGSAATSAQSVSDDGRYIAFESTATNLLPGDANGTLANVFVFDRVAQRVKRIDVDRIGVAAPDGAGFAPAISGDGSIVAFTSDSRFLVPSDLNGVADVFVSTVDRAVLSDLNGDGYRNDVVLAALDLETGVTRNTGITATLVETAGERAIAIVPERDYDGAAAPYGNGDADNLDAVAVLVEPTGPALPLGTTALAVAISEEVACWVVPEHDLDRNGDGDVFDEVVAFRFAGATTVTPLVSADFGSGRRLAAAGRFCVFLDALQQVVVLDPLAPATPIVITERPAEELLTDGTRVAFLVDEESEGGRILNGDGIDDSDQVMFVYDLPNGPLVSTGIAARRCDLPGCDPFFDPFRLRGDSISFVTSERDQGGIGYQPGNGCLPVTTPGALPGECDLNGDGDSVDLVMTVFNLKSRRPQHFAIANQSAPLVPSPVPPDALPPFPDTSVDDNVLTVQVPESSLGFDLNEDGVVNDDLVVLLAGDDDNDGVFDTDAGGRRDLCPELANAEQDDADGDGLGAACDPDDASLLPGAAPCDIDGDGDVDQSDVTLIFRDRTMQTTDSDPRDRDGDRIVTVLDAGACAAQCTLPDCASPPPPPSPAPACGLGGEVVLLLGLLGALRRLARRRHVAALIAALALASAATDARALTISLTTLSPIVGLGNGFSVDVVIADLAAPGLPALRSYDLDITFGPAGLAFAPDVVFGAQLGTPDVGSIAEAGLSAPNLLDVAQVSFLSTPTLDALQSSTSFVLATLVFRGVALGTHEISLTQIVLGDHLGAALSLELPPEPLLIEVVVPEPISLGLVGLGLGVLGVQRRRRA